LEDEIAWYLETKPKTFLELKDSSWKELRHYV